jgi:hypothetical protein
MEKIGREDIFKPTVGHEILNEISNGYNSKMFPHHNIHKYIPTSPDGKTNNKTDHYLVVTKTGERLSVSKRMAQKLYVGRFNLKQPNYMEVTEQYQVKMSTMFACLEKSTGIIRLGKV